MSLGHVIDMPSTAVATRHDAPLPGDLLAGLVKVICDPNIPLERSNAAVGFYQRARDDQAKRNFMAALSACQAEMGPVSRDASNHQTRSKYVTFAALDGALRPIYTANGFSLSFDTTDSQKPEHIRVVCILGHADGYERTYTFDAACDGKGAKGNSVMTAIHAEGSAFSYGRRYLESAIFNIASEDDDGNAASRRRDVGGVTPELQSPNVTHGVHDRRDEPDRVPTQAVDYEAGLIGPGGIQALTALIADTNSNMDRFLRFAGVGGLSEIRTSEFAKLKSMLLTKAAKAAEAAHG